MILRVSHLLAAYPEIQELDVNPARILADGSGAVALDARVRIGLSAHYLFVFAPVSAAPLSLAYLYAIITIAAIARLAAVIYRSPLSG